MAAYTLETPIILLPPDQSRIQRRRVNLWIIHPVRSGFDHANFHVRVLLNRITPSLPRFLQPASVRMADTMQSNFPQSTSTWTAVNATERVAASAGRAVALAGLGLTTRSRKDCVSRRQSDGIAFGRLVFQISNVSNLNLLSTSKFKFVS